MKPNRVLVLVLFFALGGAEAEVPAPDFLVSAGDGVCASLSNYREKIVLCFYETNSSRNMNNPLKATLRNDPDIVRAGAQGSLIVLAVADCSSAPSFLRMIWNKALISESRKEGYRIYGDWDGKMRDAFGFEKEKANFAVIDARGRVRFKYSGKLSEDGIAEATRIIRGMISE
jgi:hypothetical protein